MVRVFLVLTSGLTLLLARAALATESPASAPPSLVTLTATGEVSIVPDLAQIEVSVATHADTANAAMLANRQKMAEVLQSLHRAKIGETDIQTTGVSLSPQMIYVNAAAAKPNGFDATNGLRVTVHDFSQTGPIIDLVTQAGATGIGSVSFGVSDTTGLEDTARLKAVSTLKARAQLYAMAFGLSRVRLVRLSEGGDSEGPRVIAVTAMRMMAPAPPPATAVQPGEVKVSVSVTGEFALSEPGSGN